MWGIPKRIISEFWSIVDSGLRHVHMYFVVVWEKGREEEEWLEETCRLVGKRHA